MTVYIPPSPEFKINEFITLKLRDGKTVIFVNNERFLQCKYLLLSIPANKIEEFEKIDSIDDAKEHLNSILERPKETTVKIPPQVEFWAHCSNLQVWAEHDYDTRLLHSNLAFPLLRKLVDVGDPKAKIKFPQEIVRRFESRSKNVVKYLLVRKFLNYLTQEQKDTLLLRFFEGNDIDMIAVLLHEGALDLLSPELHRPVILHLFDLKPLLRHKDLYLTRHWLMKLFFRLSKAEKIDVLAKMVNKGKLDLSKLYLTELPKEILHFRLKELDASENELIKVPEWINKCKLLQVLDVHLQNAKLSHFSGKYQVSIPKSLGDLTQLKYLDLSLCEISHIPETIGNLKSLEILNLSRNKLNKIPQSINNLPNLKELHLDDNQLEVLPNLLNLTSLNFLSLSHNNLSIFPLFILDLINLEQLFLGYNKINKIPSNIGKLKNLKRLSLQENKLLRKIPESIGEIKNLEFLGLRDNSIEDLPDSFGNLLKLKELTIARNKIKKIPQSLKDIPSLKIN